MRRARRRRGPPAFRGEEVWRGCLLGGGRDALAEAQPLLQQLARLARPDAFVQRPLRHLPLPLYKLPKGGEPPRALGGSTAGETRGDETCPVSTEGWTRRVHFVREGGRGETRGGGAGRGAPLRGSAGGSCRPARAARSRSWQRRRGATRPRAPLIAPSTAPAAPASTPGPPQRHAPRARLRGTHSRPASEIRRAENGKRGPASGRGRAWMRRASSTPSAHSNSSAASATSCPASAPTCRRARANSRGQAQHGDPAGRFPATVPRRVCGTSLQDVAWGTGRAGTQRAREARPWTSTTSTAPALVPSAR